MSSYSFWSLISKYSIEIPIIQRDYAQGRESATTIRKEFLSNIRQHLESDKRLDLDFVYGSLTDQTFIPLDGQQRLTTLFLLHWFLLTKNNVLDEVARSMLSKFSYETRTSSKDFCNSLVNKGLSFDDLTDIINEGKPDGLSKKIADAGWFFMSWRKDPTIQSMLVMLDAICNWFKDEVGYVDKLVSDNPVVAFQFIELKDFGLTDNLYIKMNARGKPLTDFEIFKAKFEQFLDGKSSGDRSFKSEFSEKIDGKWTDLFWKHKQNNLIDGPFMRFFNFITEMLYYYDYESKEQSQVYPTVDFDLIEIVYDADNIEFLFDCLDKLCEIDDLASFFEDIFCMSNFQKDKVCLFDGEKDLFKYCISNDSWDIKERIFLFSILQFCIVQKISSANDDLKDFVRVVRNLLLRVRQQDAIIYKSDLRIRNLVDQVASIGNNLARAEVNVYEKLSTEAIELKGFTKDSLAAEKEKADIIVANPALKEIIFELEDNILTKGALHNFDLKSNVANLSKLKEAFVEIWKLKNDSLITRALLAIGDYSIYTGNSKLGEKWFFGNSIHWHTIVTYNDSRMKPIISKFLTTYIATEGKQPMVRLNEIINTWLKDNKERSWRYYFIKYSAMTATNNNLYAWEDDFKVRLLSGSSLKSPHINPYVKATVAMINDENVAYRDYGTSNDSYATPLYLRNGIRLSCTSTGWLISLPDNFALSSETIAGFELEQTQSGYYWLKDNDKHDRVEIATLFAQEVKLQKKTKQTA